MLKKGSPTKDWVRQILHSYETQHSSQLDLLELDLKIRVSHRPDCGENVSKWISQVHQIRRRWRRSWRTNAKMANEELIATTVSSREKGIRRREEEWTTSSQTMISPPGNQEESRNKLMNVDDDSPTTELALMTKPKEWKNWEEREEHDSSIALLMEMSRCVWEEMWRTATTTAAAKERRAKKRKAGSGTQSKTKHCAMNKMASGSEDMCPRSIEKDDHWNSSKNMRSMHSREKIQELVTELEGYRRDAILLNETWRHEPAEIWETQHKHIFMGAQKIRQQTRSWDHAEQKVEEQELSTPSTSTNVPSQPRSWWTVNTSSWWVCIVPHSKYADHHIEKMYKTIEKLMPNNKKCIPIIGGDFNAELGPGMGSECKNVGKHTLNESNKRGDWLKSWLMLNDYSAPNTMFRKAP